MYGANARLTNTTVVNVPRLPDFSIDEDAVLARVAEGDIDYLVVTSPNNPTGKLADEAFLYALLEATDALVMVDEAYFEFSRTTMRPALAQHENLVILRTFSKAFSLAGVRMGYLLGNAVLVRDFSRAPFLEGCLRVSIGSPEENDAFLAALRDFEMGGKPA